MAKRRLGPRRLAAWGWVGFLWLSCCGPPSVALAQNSPPINAKVVASQIRRYEPGKWGVLRVVAVNDSDNAGELLVTSFFEARKDLQFARRVWVPAHARRVTWMPIFTPREVGGRQAELISFVLDANSETDVIQRESDQTLNQTIPLNIDSQSGKTGLIMELDRIPPRILNTFAEPELPRWDEVVIDANEKQSTALDLYGDFLPPSVEMLEELDHVFLNTDQLQADSAGLQALRHWVQRGGKLWVCLNSVDSETVQALAGHAVDIQEIDRVKLDRVEFQVEGELRETSAGEPRDFDPPVEMVRVAADNAEVTLSVEGYPAAFWVPLGAGEILFTTLDAPAWVVVRPPTAPKPRPTATGYGPSTPWYPTPVLRSTVSRFYFPRAAKVTRRMDLAPALSESIGYRVMPRWAVFTVLGAFCLGLIGSGWWLAGQGRLDHLAWIAPLLAIPAAGVLMGWSFGLQQVIPPTVATTQIIRAIPETEELDIAGVSAIYRPNGGPATLGGDEDGLFQPDLETASQAPKRMVWSDLGRWSWKNLQLPRGLRTAELQGVRPSPSAVRAVATFDQGGLAGRLECEGLGDLEDWLLYSPTGPDAVPKINGTDFSLTPSNVLAQGQYLAGAIVSDVQRRRGELYAQLDEMEASLVERPSLLAWGDPLPLDFLLPEGVERTGSAMMIIPLDLRRPAPGSEILVPSPFIRLRGSSTVFNQRQGKWLGPVTNASTTELRCELPDEVLPMQPTEARLTIKMNAPSRRLTLKFNDVTVHSELNPTGEQTWTITDPEALRLDDRGALPLTISVSDVASSEEDPTGSAGMHDNWKIDYLRLDVVGRVDDGN